MAIPNSSWSEILTTTLYDRQREVRDNVSKNNALLRRLKAKGKRRPFDGGVAIVEEMEYSENGTYKRYSGYDPLNISPADVFTAAQFPIAQAAAAVSISGLEMLQNAGRAQMINLLEKRVGNAERTFVNNLSNDCYSTGTADGSKQIGGLQLLVADTATSGTVGGIDRALWPFWRNNVQSFTTAGLTAGAATIQTMMNRTYLLQKRGSDVVDLIIADNTYYRYYWESLQAIQRISRTDKAEAGYESLAFMSADVVADGDFQGVTAGNAPTGSPIGQPYTWTSGAGAPSAHMYFLNTDYIYFRPHSERDMVPLEPDRFSVNQDAMVKLMAFAGNMTMSNAFLQGVLIA